MWAYETVFYQIYPLGFCGAPFENDGILEHRISKVKDWIPHLQKLNVGAVYFCPIFESDTHGYNTRDYKKIDVRLGTNEDFKEVCTELHNAGIKVVLDGVFNHVGRGFWAFQDVLKNRENSPYVSWFSRIDFGGNSNYNDGLWYEGWEGNYDLVKLNLYNNDVVEHIFDCVKSWVDEFDIDGIRLDVAYCLTDEFCRRLRDYCDSLKEDFFLLGEVLHGEYGRILDAKNIHSVTNYQCYKGIHSAFNSCNMFEIMHSLLRLFGPEDWTVARGRHLLSFCDNHDVTRIATIINDQNCLPLVYGMTFTMPGIPSVYYGSEWGAKADKSEGDPALRPCFEKPEWNDLTTFISKLSEIKRNSKALNYGGLRSLVLTNKQCVFERNCDGDRVIVAINMDSNDYYAHFDSGCGSFANLLDGNTINYSGELVLGGYEIKILKCN
ncbi:MAG: alpha-amylase family glycosyl hydrolase [Lachnospiraceae bacterium]|nr:alpha-amylase family glycosyl hydrolase [Lachnospiraceae bacterium]